MEGTANRRKFHILNMFKGDKGIWFLYFILLSISLIAVYSSIGLLAYSAKKPTTPNIMFMRHLRWVVLSVVGAIIVSNVNYRSLSKAVVPGYLLSIVLLIIALILRIGSRVEGSGMGRWLKIPLIGSSLQPSEFAKVVMVMFMARTLTLSKDNLSDKRTYNIITVSLLVIVGLIVTQNLSTAIILFVTCYTMILFTDADKRRWLKTLAVIILAAGGLYLLFSNIQMEHNPVARKETWSTRIDNWMHPNPDELTQESLSRMAIASGGIKGKGIGNTVVGRLIESAHNDFIYSIIIEEGGMFAGIAILIIYTVLYFCCIRVAWNCPGMFGRLMVMGIGTMIYIQAVVHMGVNVGALPTTGQTLPFISQGGSSFFFLSCGLGIVQSVASDYESTRKKRVRKQRAVEAKAEVVETV